MTQGLRNKLIILLGSLAFSLLILTPTFISKWTKPEEVLPAWWAQKKIKLGLDLRGGTYLVLGVQTEEAVKSQLGSIASAIKAEMSREKVGVVKARATLDRKLQIVLLGDKGSEQVDAYVAKNFPDIKRVNSETDGGRTTLTYAISDAKAEEVKKNSVDQAIETIRNRVDQHGVSEPLIQRSGENRVIVQLPGLTDVDEVKKLIGSVAKLEFRLVTDPSNPNVESSQLRSREGETLPVEDEILMTGDSIRTARVELDPQKNEIQVLLSFNSGGAEIFDQVTAANVRRRLAIVLDGVVQSAPRINERISGGTAQITGGFTTEDAKRLAIVLKSGALPAPLTFEEQRTVGASLGQDSIDKGLIASFIGAILVVIFMCVYYKKSGVLAIACLAMNIIWLLAMLALFGGTLTLPGIAGLALTVGMAVDANIIIYERIRDELRTGASVKASVEAGFLRAHWTILDANITTLLTGIILYGFGTGPIKGFAVTLSLGILTTVAAALFASHLGFSVLKLRNAKGELSI